MDDRCKDLYGLGDWLNIERYNPKNKNLNIRYELNKILDLLIHRFKYKNLPEEIDQHYIELLFICAGNELFFKEGNRYYVTYGNLGGTQDYRYFPVDYIVTNPWIGENGISKTFKIENDEDGVLGRNDYMMQGEIPLIYKHLTIKTETELSEFIAVIMGRLNAIIRAGDDKAQKSAQLLIDRIKEGEFGVMVEDRILDKQGVQATPLNSSLHDTLITLIEYHKFNDEQLYSKLGLTHNGNMKREAINEAELDNDNYSTMANIIDPLEMRKDWVNRINKKYGLNIEVEYAGAFELQYSDIELDIEKEEAEIEQIEAETENIEKEEVEEVKEENKEDEKEEGEEDEKTDEND